MPESKSQTTSKFIADRIDQLNDGYIRLLRMPYSFYDLKQIREKLRELHLQLKALEFNNN